MAVVGWFPLVYVHLIDFKCDESYKIFTILSELLHISSHDRADVKYQSDISEVLFSSSASAADASADAKSIHPCCPAS